ncbi:hypothetical protein TVAG_449240 [Trichomonas vaginalis G3]|uniref:Uncharacterized protein n=1 Tax=Trichomonas vaginalis (strain ATCC PRA-98 / G3) TaxID=412133 RepID=A2FI72_TRIV3|nr:hypothetical protein TVAGG3_0618140 [Trichomonas vaginalis G3]EAX95390.1 hypothetical protein TVAG_449240 [Trichomonas vaginalis G3]KAI5503706.1 hypothetical protein TVAGG3_0618140 [Trichomonas vaginalis G3]|eukprot:XP_001308320.1 hypothetical protein [Trichomonas vaginalis G3]
MQHYSFFDAPKPKINENMKPMDQRAFYNIFDRPHRPIHPILSTRKHQIKEYIQDEDCCRPASSSLSSLSFMRP